MKSTFIFNSFCVRRDRRRILVFRPACQSCCVLARHSEIYFQFQFFFFTFSACKKLLIRNQDPELMLQLRKYCIQVTWRSFLDTQNRFLKFKGRGPVKKVKNRRKCRGFKRLTIDTIHTPFPCHYTVTLRKTYRLLLLSAKSILLYSA